MVNFKCKMCFQSKKSKIILCGDSRHYCCIDCFQNWYQNEQKSQCFICKQDTGYVYKKQQTPIDVNLFDFPVAIIGKNSVSYKIKYANISITYFNVEFHSIIGKEYHKELANQFMSQYQSYLVNTFLFNHTSQEHLIEKIEDGQICQLIEPDKKITIYLENLDQHFQFCYDEFAQKVAIKPKSQKNYKQEPEFQIQWLDKQYQFVCRYSVYKHFVMQQFQISCYTFDLEENNMKDYIELLLSKKMFQIKQQIEKQSWFNKDVFYKTKALEFVNQQLTHTVDIFNNQELIFKAKGNNIQIQLNQKPLLFKYNFDHKEYNQDKLIGIFSQQNEKLHPLYKNIHIKQENGIIYLTKK